MRPMPGRTMNFSNVGNETYSSCPACSVHRTHTCSSLMWGSLLREDLLANKFCNYMHIPAFWNAK